MTRLCVLIPIGPGLNLDFVRDSLESVRHYYPDSLIVAVDDTTSDIAGEISDLVDHVEMTPGNGPWGGVYLTISQGMQFALSRDWDVLLRFDTDAVVAGNTFAERAHKLFVADPGVGQLGIYKKNYDGSPRSSAWPRERLYFTYRPKRLVQSPARAAATAGMLVRAKRHGHGYVIGDSILGAVSLFSRLAVETLARRHRLNRPALAKSLIHEDHLFSTLLVGEGFRMDDFGTAHDDLPIGATHRFLPAPPDELIAAGKELIHSTKGSHGLDEEGIRAVFRAERQRR